ncbi:hypothetical protein Tco_1036962, partial [Tanacetum coccineum]
VHRCYCSPSTVHWRYYSSKKKKKEEVIPMASRDQQWYMDTGATSHLSSHTDDNLDTSPIALRLLTTPTSPQQTPPQTSLEVDIQEKDKNKAKKDKAEHDNEKNVSKSQQSKSKSTLRS